MTAPTNWPNPERPGYPMFPERDGLHAFTMADYPGYVVFQWISANNEYTATSCDGEISYSPDEISQEYEYHGPVITPTQLTEMMAGEQERAAKKAQEISDKYYDERENADNDDDCVYADERMCAAQECADAIRNLGAAP